MPGRFDTPGKKAVREIWNTPILTHLHTKYGIKYRYLGLPGVELIDINLWKSMIEEIVAFEMPAGGGDERVNIKRLKRNLEILGLPWKAYYGSIEQVILMRQDLDALAYIQSKVINLYNLDFCDEITSKIITADGEKCLRFELIRQLLADQHECYKLTGENAAFIILLTARNQAYSKRIYRYLFGSDLSSLTEKYIKAANKKNPIPTEGKNLIGTHGWALKAFVYDTIIKSYFPTPHITSLIFPMLKYTGMPVDAETPSPMLHWMMLCKFEKPELPRPRVYPGNFLEKSSLMVDHGAISLSGEPGERTDSDTNPLKVLRKYEEHFFS